MAGRVGVTDWHDGKGSSVRLSLWGGGWRAGREVAASVPAGGAVIREFTPRVPGRYLLVDHALSRLERGLPGFIMVEGAPQPDLFKPYSAASGTGH